MKVTIFPFLLHWLPYFALNIFANQLGGRGVFNYFKTEKYNLLKAIVFIKGTFTLFRKKPLEFKVTPKTVGASVYLQERQEVTGYIVILGIIILAMVYSLIILFLPHAHQVTRESFIIALIWSTYNSFIIYLAVREILTKRHERKKYRFPVIAEGEILDANTGQVMIDSCVIDLSITGAGLLAEKEAPEGKGNLNLKIMPEKFDDITLPIEKITNRWSSQSGKNTIGILFSNGLGPQRNLLFEYLFIHLPRSDENELYHVNNWNPLKLFQKSSS